MREKINAFFRILSISYLFAYAVAAGLIYIFFQGAFQLGPYLLVLGSFFLYFCPFYFAFIEIGTTINALFRRNKPSGFERMVHALRAILIFCVFFTLKDFSYHRDVAVHMALGWLILKILSLILFWRPWRESEFPKTKRHPLAGIAMSVLFGFALLALINFSTFF